MDPLLFIDVHGHNLITMENVLDIINVLNSTNTNEQKDRVYIDDRIDDYLAGLCELIQNIQSSIKYLREILHDRHASKTRKTAMCEELMGILGQAINMHYNIHKLAKKYISYNSDWHDIITELQRQIRYKSNRQSASDSELNTLIATGIIELLSYVKTDGFIDGFKLETNFGDLYIFSEVDTLTRFVFIALAFKTIDSMRDEFVDNYKSVCVELEARIAQQGFKSLKRQQHQDDRKMYNR